MKERNELVDRLRDKASRGGIIPIHDVTLERAADMIERGTVVTEEMVTRFLGWRLPEDFSPDCGISFTKRPRNDWPVGTNLLTAAQARAMLEHVLRATDMKSEYP